MEELVVDPVCGMQVKPGQYPVEYLQVNYSFCSQQCHDRFLANPRLYIGVPGQDAPKHAGLEVMKRRRMRLAQPLSAEQAGIVRDNLLAMMGVQAVSVEGDCVTIVYDLLQATAEQLERKLEVIGLQLGEGWTERLRRAFVHYEEDCEAGSLEVDPKRTGHRH